MVALKGGLASFACFAEKNLSRIWDQELGFGLQPSVFRLYSAKMSGRGGVELRRQRRVNTELQTGRDFMLYLRFDKGVNFTLSVIRQDL